MSPIREQMIGVVTSIVLVFLLTGGAALYCLLYVSVTWAAIIMCAQLVSVPFIAAAGYDHGRDMVSKVRHRDAIAMLLTVSTCLALLIAALTIIVLLQRAGLMR